MEKIDPGAPTEEIIKLVLPKNHNHFCSNSLILYIFKSAIVDLVFVYILDFTSSPL